MEFGLFSNGLRPSRAPADAWDEDMFEIQLADELGLREAWISEHSSPAELLICKAAGLTRRIRLGTAVRLLPLYHPVNVVVDANTCDQLSHGRYLFGFGLGFFKVKMEERGIDAAHGRAMLNESLDFILKCWSSPEPFDFEGQFWSGRNIQIKPATFQQPHPPIAVACHESRETVQLAGSRGFMPLFSQVDHPLRMADVLASYDASGGQRSSVRACRTVYVSDSVASAKRELLPTLGVALEWEKRNTPHHFERYVPEGGTLDDCTLDYLVQQGRYVIGDPDTVCERITRFHHDTGGFGTLMLHMGRDYGERDARARSMRLFMDEVAPRLRDL